MAKALKYSLSREELLLCVTSSALLSTAFWILAMSWQPLLSDLFNVDESLYGLTWSIMLLAASLGSFASTPLLKTLGIRASILLALALTTCSYIALSTFGITHLGMAIALILIIEFSIYVYTPLLNTIYNVVMPTDLRSTLLSLISSINYLAQGITSAMLGALLSIRGYNLLYLIAASTTALAILPIHELINKTDRMRK